LSRTDRHAPYWTWCEWYEPCHSIWCEHYISRLGQKVPKQACNLPERPVRHAGVRTRVYVGLCTWEPVWPGREVAWMARWKGRHEPHWFIRHVWSGPERVRERDQLGKMVKEYNATGDLEHGDFPNWQARNCARWLWD
jgi:hypothetical protein